MMHDKIVLLVKSKVNTMEVEGLKWISPKAFEKFQAPTLAL